MPGARPGALVTWPGARPGALVALAVTLIAAAMTSCTAGRINGAAAIPAPSAAAPRLYVAVGASDTRGVGTDDPLRQAWPQDLFRMLPANYRLVNLGIPNATLSVALDQELPMAEGLHPAVVTVWLNAIDVLSGVPTAMYQSELSTLVHRLRATAAVVLVANTPPLDDLPAYLACVDRIAHPGGCPSFLPTAIPPPQQVVAAVEGYNAAIAAVVAQEGAVLVDLHRSGLAARALGEEASLVSTDGFHPNAAGAAMIASQFAAAIPK